MGNIGRKHKIKLDGLLVTTFVVNLFYSATYPFIHKEIIANVSDGIIAANQIVNCLSIVIIGGLWNKKSDAIFRHYPAICIAETVLGVGSTICAVLTENILLYYIIDTLIFCIVTRNICCGGVKLKAMRYPSEKEREHFDNNNNSCYAVATIIGSITAMWLDLDLITMLWIATVGNAVDNVFYIIIYLKNRREREKSDIHKA